MNIGTSWKKRAAFGAALFALCVWNLPAADAQIPGGTLDPLSVPKFQTPLLIPPVMPKAGTIKQKGGKNVDYYEISVKQFSQQILPAGLPPTTVWGYGAVTSASKNGLLLHNAPSLTIEADWNRPVRVKWINDLKDASGNYLPHLLPVDPTVHWANPAGGTAGRDTRPTFASTPDRYTGPVPMVTHVHGSAGVGDESDGYAEAWYLPAAGNIPAGYADNGTWYEFFKGKAAGKGYLAPGTTAWEPGTAVFQYPNSQRASTIWYHDHTLGMTRVNVYAGPAGFFIIRGGPEGDGSVLDSRTGTVPGRPPRRTTSSRPTRPTTRSPSPSRTVPSMTMARSSIRTPGPSSMGSRGRTSRIPTSPPSGTRSSSATRSWSTGTPGRS
jgi:spore coat protein A